MHTMLSDISHIYMKKPKYSYQTHNSYNLQIDIKKYLKLNTNEILVTYLLK